ncbi:MAG: EcsC family protein [Thermoanaerobaculia bacterium]|nr:EcsC family protein [Thermoanaerobaculia bacterium]
MSGSAVNLSETFLDLVQRASSDIDIDRIREDVREFSRRHSDLTTKEKARRLVDVTARKAAGIGAVASLPPGWASLAAAGPELAGIIVLQSRLIVGLHVLYGREPEPSERALEVLAGLASGYGVQIGRKLTVRAAEQVAARLFARYLGRKAATVIPIIGAAAGALLNYFAVQAVGRAVTHRIETLYGPPGLGGKGPVIDVERGPG